MLRADDVAYIRTDARRLIRTVTTFGLAKPIVYPRGTYVNTNAAFVSAVEGTSCARSGTFEAFNLRRPGMS